ncbi:MAG: hypothetical protein QW730_02615 [Candidatus Nezhaarchaeales archaeon]
MKEALYKPREIDVGIRRRTKNVKEIKMSRLPLFDVTRGNAMAP